MICWVAALVSGPALTPVSGLVSAEAGVKRGGGVSFIALHSYTLSLLEKGESQQQLSGKSTVTLPDEKKKRPAQERRRRRTTALLPFSRNQKQK